MHEAWKPQGYPSLSPYLMVPDARRTIAFLRDAFGATELRRFDGPGGGVMHGEVRIDDGVLMLADAVGDWRPFPVFLHLYVRDVDASYRRAIELGATPVQEPRQQEGDPDRRGGVKDPAGNTWWISTQLGGEAQYGS